MRGRASRATVHAHGLTTSCDWPNDLDDAMAMAREAIEGHFEILAEDGAPIPNAQKVTLHAANPQYAGCTWAVVDIDVTKYLGKAEFDRKKRSSPPGASL